MDSQDTGQDQLNDPPVNEKTVKVRAEDWQKICKFSETMVNVCRLYSAASSEHGKKEKKLQMQLAEVLIDPEAFEGFVDDYARLKINHAGYQKVIDDLTEANKNLTEANKGLKKQLDGQTSQHSSVDGGQEEREDKLEETEDKAGMEVGEDEVKEMAESMERIAAEWAVKVKADLARAG